MLSKQSDKEKNDEIKGMQKMVMTTLRQIAFRDVGRN